MDKKDKQKAGSFFGIAMSLFLIISHLLTQAHLTTKEVTGIFVFGLIGGVVGGFLFGWTIGLFVNSKSVKRATKITLQDNETVVFESGANHFKGIEAVGGRLYLTTKRLVFKSHRFNFQNHKLSIALTDIIHADRYKTMGITNNGIAITTSKGIEKFVAQKPEEWMIQLTDRNDIQQVVL